MQRYNFDRVSAKASGFGVHANTKRSAWARVYKLAKKYNYNGKLTFRDNEKCPKIKTYRGSWCYECWPNGL